MQNNPGSRWIVLAAAVPILALVMGQLANGLSVYFVPLEVEFGWDRGDIALINSVGLVGLALSAPLTALVGSWFTRGAGLAIGIPPPRRRLDRAGCRFQGPS